MAAHSHFIERFPSRMLNIGGTAFGKDSPVRIQSMTTTDSRDIPSTVDQCIRCFDAGADLMRIAIPDKASARALIQIKSRIRKAGFRMPIAADIHFSKALAMEVAGVADKIRINPGNLISGRPADSLATPSEEHPGDQKNVPEEKDEITEMLYRELKPLADKCRDHGTAIRIGCNAASLPRHIIANHGRGAAGLVEASIEYLRVFKLLSFEDIIVSVKSSNPTEMIRAGLAMSGRMLKEGMNYPFHTGLTEAGSGIEGRVRSAYGIISLLKLGIGDTFRVSLSEKPENEIGFAKHILAATKPGKARAGISAGSDMIEIVPVETEAEKLIVEVVDQYISMPGQMAGKKLAVKPPQPGKEGLCRDIETSLLQAAGISSEHTEIISCPGCARAGADMESVCREVKMRLPDMPGKKFAVMGCIVNGPGEMHDADYGVISTGGGNFKLFVKGRMISGRLSLSGALERIEQLAREDSGNV